MAKKPSQVELFKEKARELGCDEDEAAFEKRLRKIAKSAPVSQEKPTPEVKKRRTP